jgi:hypothetical protein
MSQDHPERDHAVRSYPAEKARQGEIILTKNWQRIIFFGAIAAAILLLVILRLLVWHST